MRKRVLTGCTWLLAGALLITASCKKAEDPAAPAPATTTTTTTDPNPEKTSSSDESDVQASADAALTDANTTLSATGSVSKMESETVKNATVDTSQAMKYGIITITYTGANEDSTKNRSGVITLTKLTPKLRWKDQGASFLVAFNNFKTTNIKSQKSLTFNGYKRFTNTTGGRVIDLFSTTPPTSVAFSAHGKLTITFDDGSKRDWAVYRLTTYTKGANYEVITKISGDTSIAGVANVVEAGTNRNNEKFTNVISTPIEYHKSFSSTGCKFNKPYAGVRTHTGDRTYTMTMGLDASGNPIPSGICPTTSSFKLTWVSKDGPKSITITN